MFVCFHINIVKEVDMIFKATGDVCIVQYDETHSEEMGENFAKKWFQIFITEFFKTIFLRHSRKVQMNFIQRVDRANF